MKLKNLYDSFVETGRLSSVALFCVGTASAFGWLLATTDPQGAARERFHVGMGITARDSSSPSCSWWWLLPRRHTCDHHFRHDPAAARAIVA